MLGARLPDRRLGTQAHGVLAESHQPGSDEADLRDAGIITPETAHLVEGLRALASLASHAPGGDPSPENAAEFLTLTGALIWATDANAQRRPG